MFNGKHNPPVKVELVNGASIDPNPVTQLGQPDDVLSPIAQRDVVLRQQALQKTPIKQVARKLLSERLKHEQSGISLRELDDATAKTRGKVEAIARSVVDELVQRGHNATGPLLSEAEANALLAYLMATQFGAGELEPLFHEPDVEDIVINTTPNGRRSARVEVWTYRQSGKRREVLDISPDEVIEIVNRAASRQGRQLSPVTPIINAELLNGARINAALNPVVHPLLSVTIRIHRLVARSFGELVRLGTLTPAAAGWLYLCVRARLAICVGGGTSSGKTHLLNAMARLIHPDERIVCIEDTRELDLAVPDKVYLRTVTSQDGARVVTQRQLVANALRMRPDRLVIGEVRDGAAFDALKATNTGHDGTLLTIHAESAEGVTKRLIQLASEAPEAAILPERTLREYVMSAFQCIVYLERQRLPSGATQRHVTQIVEVPGFMQNEQVSAVTLFARVAKGLEWTRAWPSERTKQRIYAAGFNHRDIEDALNGRLAGWDEGVA